MEEDIEECNPLANIFIFINLGCEMLYVIDQRLRAQDIMEAKAAQVMHDITTVLLDAKFIESIIAGSTHPNGKLLTHELCKFMLRDIALSSVMHMDQMSMDRLWNLMTMIYKWQLFLTKHKYHLMDITFRHLDGIAVLYANEFCYKLIDSFKNVILEFWNGAPDAEQTAIYETNKSWLTNCNFKISFLVRLGFQQEDASFVENVQESYFQQFVDYLGENIYTKATKMALQRRQEFLGTMNSHPNVAQQMSTLDDFLYLPKNACTLIAKQQQQQKSPCNIIFDNLVPTTARPPVAEQIKSNIGSEFVQLPTVYKK